MCGIAGRIDWRGIDQRARVTAMCAKIARRGPDAECVEWHGAATLGHRRLSIIDLSEQANQPMRDASGRYTIVFNGVIYNYRDVAAELAGTGVDKRIAAATAAVSERVGQNVHSAARETELLRAELANLRTLAGDTASRRFASLQARIDELKAMASEGVDNRIAEAATQSKAELTSALEALSARAAGADKRLNEAMGAFQSQLGALGESLDVKIADAAKAP